MSAGKPFSIRIAAHVELTADAQSLHPQNARVRSWSSTSLAVGIQKYGRLVGRGCTRSMQASGSVASQIARTSPSGGASTRGSAASIALSARRSASAAPAWPPEATSCAAMGVANARASAKAWTCARRRGKRRASTPRTCRGADPGIIGHQGAGRRRVREANGGGTAYGCRGDDLIFYTTRGRWATLGDGFDLGKKADGRPGG